MTLAEYRASVRGLLSDAAYDSALVDEAINWAQYEIFNDTRTRLMETSDQVYGSLGDTEVEFPENLMTRINFYLVSPAVIDLRAGHTEYATFMQNYANFSVATSQQASTWTEFGKSFRFSAPLNADHTFQLDYLREPVKMEADDDDAEIPDRYSELMSKLALARIMEINEDYGEAQTERTNLQGLYTTFKRNEGRGGGKTGPATVMRTNRGRSTGFRADRDF